MLPISYRKAASHTGFSGRWCGFCAFRQHRTKPARRLCTQSACWFFVILPRNSLPYNSMPAEFLCNLPKNPASHLTHKLCAVLPKRAAVKPFGAKNTVRLRRIFSGKNFFSGQNRRRSKKPPAPLILFSEMITPKNRYIQIQKEKFHYFKFWKIKTSKKCLTVPGSCAIIIIVAAHECWCSSVGRAADL